MKLCPIHTHISTHAHQQQNQNAKVFLWDTGNSVGELNGHGKRVASCAYRPCRPFRLITASEDTRTVFYAGPPFVLDHSNNDAHSNWVNAVRYSPDGQRIVSVGSDKKVGARRQRPNTMR
jgi:WD40 repeat protein